MLTELVVQITSGSAVPRQVIRTTCAAFAFGRTASQRRTLYRLVEVLARKTNTPWAALGDTPDDAIDAHFLFNLTRAAALISARDPAPGR